MMDAHHNATGGGSSPPASVDGAASRCRRRLQQEHAVADGDHNGSRTKTTRPFGTATDARRRSRRHRDDNVGGNGGHQGRAASGRQSLVPVQLVTQTEARPRDRRKLFFDDPRVHVIVPRHSFDCAASDPSYHRRGVARPPRRPSRIRLAIRSGRDDAFIGANARRAPAPRSPMTSRRRRRHPRPPPPSRPRRVWSPLAPPPPPGLAPPPSPA